MIINDRYKFIVLLPPRCASHSIKNTLLQNFEYCRTKHTPTPNGKTHHHTKLENNWFDGILNYNIIVPTREIMSWAKSCYSNFVGNFERIVKEENITFTDFVLKYHGIDRRYKDKAPGFDWFGHSPQNILLKDGKLEKFKGLYFIRHDHYQDDIHAVLNFLYGPRPKFTKIFHKNSFIPRVEENFDPKIKNEIERLSCPLGKNFGIKSIGILP
jgi:hypothetical protein